ncbi:hypothetical protein HPC49_23910 [Pyxidicoccus fallax]|uniref:AMIN-like domain-containing protein n=1 Tax=Pyxidicoccus fallax TaxID=394095 RepID=A0A848LQ53_9BACT|nr:hypothetical protein [Pyxidicoccus fallax]NMO19703.1 hypothetical protein [Pyxidicoccus fallax]NPC81262.1 hypothetical protein [Pyxidicoccus fallax]
MKRSGRGLTSLLLVGCIGVAGCKKEEPPPPHPAAELPAPEDSPAQPTRPPEGTIPREGEAAANPPVHVVVPADGGTGAPVRTGDEAPQGDTAQAPAPAPAPAPANAADLPPEDLKNREWTARNVELKRRPGKSVTLRSVRAGQHADYDRVVFEFEGMQLPGYALEYVDKPIIQCGSGDPTPVAGQGWLQVRLTPARGHDDQGRATVAEREMKPGLPIILELERTCDFEGEVTWVLGNKKPNKFRVMELRDPARLVVDVQH